MKYYKLLFFIITILYFNISLAQDIEKSYENFIRFRDQKQLDSMFRYFNRTIEQSKASKNFLYQAKASIAMGNYYQDINDSDSLSYRHYYHALQAYKKIGDSLKIGKTLLRLAIIEKNTKNYIKSKETSFEALECIGNRDRRLKASTYNNLGIIFNELKDIDNAVKFHSHSFRLRKELLKPVLELQSINNIAVAYLDNRNFSESEAYFIKGLSYADSLLIQSPKEYARLLDNYGFLKFLTKQTKAIDYFEKALKIRQQHRDRLGLIVSYLHLARYFLKTGDYKKSYEYVNKAYKDSNTIRDYKATLESLQTLADIEVERGNMDKALFYERKLKTISTTLYEKEMLVSKKFAEIRYQVKQIQVENEQLQKNIQWQKKINRLWIGLIIFSIISFIFIYKTLKSKSTINDLQYKKKEETYDTKIAHLLLESEHQLNKGIHIERDRIGKELHDGIINELYGIRLILEGLNQENDIESQLQRKKYIRKIHDAEKQISYMVADLNRTISSSEVYQKILSDFFEDRRKSTEIEIIENLTEYDWSVVKSSIKVNLYRIIQETFHNTQKYAEASRYSIYIDTGNKLLLDVIISDNGKGSVKSKKGNGLKNIKNRVHSLGGSIEISSTTKASGFTYAIKIPLNS